MSASSTLRRLYGEATTDCLCGLPSCQECRTATLALRSLRLVAPAIIELVAHEEAEHANHLCVRYGSCLTLIALREELEGK